METCRPCRHTTSGIDCRLSTRTHRHARTRRTRTRRTRARARRHTHTHRIPCTATRLRPAFAIAEAIDQQTRISKLSKQGQMQAHHQCRRPCETRRVDRVQKSLYRFRAAIEMFAVPSLCLFRKTALRNQPDEWTDRLAQRRLRSASADHVMVANVSQHRAGTSRAVLTDRDR